MCTKGAKFRLVFDPTLVLGRDWATTQELFLRYQCLGLAQPVAVVDDMTRWLESSRKWCTGLWFSIGFEKELSCFSWRAVSRFLRVKEGGLSGWESNPADKLVDVMNQAKDAEQTDSRCLLCAWTRTKKFQKNGLWKRATRSLLEFFNR